MRTTGIFTAYTYLHKIDTFDPFNIYFFSDIHKKALAHNSEKWRESVDTMRADARALYVGVGDYTEIGSTKERKAISALRKEAHDSLIARMDENILDDCNDFANDISFMGDRLIGLIGGNHDAQLESGIFASQKLCDILQTKFLGVCAHIRLTVQYDNRRTSVTLFLHHGKGGGTDGNQINKVEDLSRIADADIYAMGDSHGRSMACDAKFYLSKPDEYGNIESVSRDKVYMRTGSFLDGYVNGKSNYVTDMALKPTSLGCVRVRVTPKREFYNVGDKRKEKYYLKLTPEFV